MVKVTTQIFMCIHIMCSKRQCPIITTNGVSTSPIKDSFYIRMWYFLFFQFARKNGLTHGNIPYSELDVETRVKVLRVTFMFILHAIVMYTYSVTSAAGM